MQELPQAFVEALRGIVGDEGFITNPSELVVYECDAYTLEKMQPHAVVLPKDTEEVAAVVRLCAEHNLPIIPRGAGTSLSGGVLAVTGGVMIGLSRMSRILSVDYRNRRAYVPDCVRLTAANVDSIAWLPRTCAYRLRANGEPLPDWHYLVSGDRDAVHRAGESVRGWTVSEDLAGDFEHHLVDREL